MHVQLHHEVPAALAAGLAVLVLVLTGRRHGLSDVRDPLAAVQRDLLHSVVDHLARLVAGVVQQLVQGRATRSFVAVLLKPVLGIVGQPDGHCRVAEVDRFHASSLVGRAPASVASGSAANASRRSPSATARAAIASATPAASPPGPAGMPGTTVPAGPMRPRLPNQYAPQSVQANSQARVRGIHVHDGAVVPGCSPTRTASARATAHRVRGSARSNRMCVVRAGVGIPTPHTTIACSPSAPRTIPRIRESLSRSVTATPRTTAPRRMEQGRGVMWASKAQPRRPGCTRHALSDARTGGPANRSADTP